MRPVLSKQGVIEASAIWHSLSIKFHSQGDEDTITHIFALDHEDLVSLRNQINLALETQSGIQREMERTGVSVWTPYIDEEDLL
jgi:hypothetical protein